MTHRIRIVLLAAGTALAALASPSIALAQTKLIGTVADPGTISLRTEAGAAVTDLPAGTYTIEVRDQSISHNFHLSGPGVDQRTDVETVDDPDLDGHPPGSGPLHLRLRPAQPRHAGLVHDGRGAADATSASRDQANRR